MSYVRRRRHKALSVVIPQMLERLLRNLCGSCFYNFSPIANTASVPSASGRSCATGDPGSIPMLTYAASAIRSECYPASRETYLVCRCPQNSLVLRFVQDNVGVLSEVSSSTFTICVFVFGLAQLPFHPVFSEQFHGMLRADRSITATEIVGRAVLLASPAETLRMLWDERYFGSRQVGLS